MVNIFFYVGVFLLAFYCCTLRFVVCEKYSLTTIQGNIESHEFKTGIPGLPA